jgi:hypothetical protein
MSNEEIWQHAKKHFVNSAGEPYNHHGAAITLTASIRKAGVEALAHEPPPKHANLRGWPKHEDPELQKAQRKAVATRIADEAKWKPVS